ncbi:uncharacterized protein DMAD_05740 [Drosophila madeirensis]|uniref:Uncharacterized protein n=1 Tax=Drosophila madeirensis TaxID=30013 RepID=A0AAU9FN90_DROMD
MDFVTVFSTGGSVEYVVREYATAFMGAIFADPQNWHAKVSHQFVGQCFHVMGLKFNVSVKAFRKTQEHPYRNDNPNYVFDAVPFVMTAVESFLAQLPTVLYRYAKSLEPNRRRATTAAAKRFHELTDPLSCYLKVVLTWTKVVHYICEKMQQDPSAGDKYLCEPVARMSFSILYGLSKLLPTFNNVFEGFKHICFTLTIDARYGMFFQATSNHVLKPMLDMFREHYETFCGVENSALGFVYYTLAIVMEDESSYIMAYEFLETMIKQFAQSQQRDPSGNLYLRLFTNELITDRFLALHFEVLKSSKSKALLMATLLYIQTLQGHIVSAERFPTRFHEIILELLLRLPVTLAMVCSMAAKLYVELVQRQYSEKEIVVHILETYIKSQYKPRRNPSFAQFRAQLTRYLKTIMQHFPALGRFKIYECVFTTQEVRIELSVIAAQSVSVIFDLYLLDYSTSEVAREQVHDLLHMWPDLITSLANPSSTRAVLYSIYSVVNFMDVASNNLELLLTLENFCLDKFLHDETLSDSEISGLYTNLSRSVEATGNRQIHITAAGSVQYQHAQLQAQMNANDLDAEQREELLEAYGQCLRRLLALLRANKLSGDHLVEMLDSVVLNLLEKPQQKENLSIFGSESLAFMLIRLHKEHKDVIGMAQQLCDFCVYELTNSTGESFKRSKFMFCSVVILHIGLQNDFPLDAPTYDALLMCLTATPTGSQHSCDQLTQSYIQEMHLLFRQMLACDQVALPNNRIWRALLHTTVPGAAAQVLRNELDLLAGVLIEHRVICYVHCLSVIQLRFGNEASANKRMTATLNAHLRLIDSHASAVDAWMLRWTVFHGSLELLIKKMGAVRLEATTAQVNRLLPLQHLQLIVANMRLKEIHFLKIAHLICSLKEAAIGSKERAEIGGFINQISAFKYRCEDENAEQSISELFEGKLLSVPPGPMTLWQHKAMGDLDVLNASE